MQKPLDLAPTATALDDLGAIRVQGAEAVKFLQGQLSNDVTKLSPEQPLLAGFHNPQGRVIALLRLVSLGAEDILALLPRELAAPVAARLGKFILRARVKLCDDSSSWRVTGIASEPPPGELFVRTDLATPRGWLVTPTNKPTDLAGYSNLDRESWRALDIAAGIPQVYAATSEAFVAQMLNLDVLGAISFDKGCYTGQEIIARAHYRGRVKRRMQRFSSHAPLQLVPGSSGVLDDGRSYEVVDAARLPDGHIEFLAVAQVLDASQ
jgi:tRNA-modifying protein YgfZ